MGGERPASRPRLGTSRTPAASDRRSFWKVRKEAEAREPQRARQERGEERSGRTFSGSERPPTVDGEGCSSHVAAGVTGEEDGRAGDLIGLRRPVERDAGHHTAHDLGIVDQRRGESSFYQSGGDGIDAYPRGGQL